MGGIGCLAKNWIEDDDNDGDEEEEKKKIATEVCNIKLKQVFDRPQCADTPKLWHCEQQRKERMEVGERRGVGVTVAVVVAKWTAKCGLENWTNKFLQNVYLVYQIVCLVETIRIWHTKSLAQQINAHSNGARMNKHTTSNCVNTEKATKFLETILYYMRALHLYDSIFF